MVGHWFCLFFFMYSQGHLEYTPVVREHLLESALRPGDGVQLEKEDKPAIGAVDSGRNELPF